MVKISKNYKPSKNEKFMNPTMKKYFRLKLINWKNNLLKESSNTLNNLQKEENVRRPDLADRVTEEIERTFELRTRDRERKLIAKIDEAIKKLIVLTMDTVKKQEIQLVSSDLKLDL